VKAFSPISTDLQWDFLGSVDVVSRAITVLSCLLHQGAYAFERHRKKLFVALCPAKLCFNKKISLFATASYVMPGKSNKVTIYKYQDSTNG
jgi:hypothetical protein